MLNMHVLYKYTVLIMYSPRQGEGQRSEPAEAPGLSIPPSESKDDPPGGVLESHPISLGENGAAFQHVSTGRKSTVLQGNNIASS